MEESQRVVLRQEQAALSTKLSSLTMNDSRTKATESLKIETIQAASQHFDLKHTELATIDLPWIWLISTSGQIAHTL